MNKQSKNRETKMIKSANKTTYLRSTLFGMLMVITGVALSGCSGDSNAGESDNSIAQPEVVKTTEVNGDIPDPPSLTKAQERTATRIAKADPTVQAVIDGGQAEFGRVDPWSRSNMELLGGAVSIKLDPPRSFEDVEWPEITNLEELYGKGYDQEGGGDPNVEPDLRPEIGTTTRSETDVKRLIVMVDLEADQVADIKIMSR